MPLAIPVSEAVFSGSANGRRRSPARTAVPDVTDMAPADAETPAPVSIAAETGTAIANLEEIHASPLAVVMRHYQAD